MNFADLIHPMSTAEFFSEYWEKRPVIIPGKPDRFSSLFSFKDIGRFLHYMRPRTPEGLLIVKEGRPAHMRWTEVDGSPRLKKVRDAWREGHTILINRLENAWEPIALLKAALEEELHHRIDTDMYLTPANAQGFPFHFDIMDVFILQVQGSKLWQVREPIIHLPLPDEHYDIPQDRLPPLMLEEELKAGGVLYMPRGHVHAGRATGEPSLHVSVGVNVTTWMDLFTAAISAARKDPQFRKALPPAFFDKMADMQSGFDHLLGDLPKSLGLDDAIGRIAERLIVNTPPPPDDDYIADDAEVHADSIVSRRKGVICRVTQGAGHATIQFSGGRISGPEKIAPALQFIVQNRSFPVRALPGGLSDKEKLVLVRRFIHEGLLEVKEPGELG